MYISYYEKTLRRATVFNNPCSLYNGVLIIWDNDYDDRIFDFVDSLVEPVREMLLACNERKGMLELIWKQNKFIPDHLAEGESVDIAGDTWHILSSVGE